MLLIEIQIPIGIELYVKGTINVTLKSVKINKYMHGLITLFVTRYRKDHNVITLHMHDLIQTNII